MKIDYDKPVKGRLANGYYWMAHNDSLPGEAPYMVIVYRGATKRYAVETDPAGGQLRRVSEWREIGWQFYPARLPKGKGKR